MTIDFEKADRKISEMRQNLKQIASGELTREERAGIIDSLIQEQSPEGFFNVLSVNKMPSDARVDFLYIPTYIAAATFIAADMSGDKIERNNLELSLKASTGRDFAGHGYDSYRGFLDTLDIFLEAPTTAFLRKHPDIAPRFRELWQRVPKRLLLEGVNTEGFEHDEQTSQKSAELLARFDLANETKQDLSLREGERYYFAYGSNMKQSRMNERCPEARFIQTALLMNTKLCFRQSQTGFFASIDNVEGAITPVLVWAVNQNDEATLDRFEGVGNPMCYLKENIVAVRGNHTFAGFIYRLPEHRPYGEPSTDYLNIIRQAYTELKLPSSSVFEGRNAHICNCG